MKAVRWLTRLRHDNEVREDFQKPRMVKDEFPKILETSFVNYENNYEHNFE